MLWYCTWRLKAVVSRGGGGAGRVAETRGSLAATRVEIAKAREEAASLEFLRVPYDVSSSQNKIISEGLPSYLAERLELAR